MKISIRDRSVHPSLDRAFEIAQNLGFDGVELSIGGPSMPKHLIWRREGLMKMADFLQEASARISSAHLGSYEMFGLNRPLGQKLFQALLPRAAKLHISALTVEIAQQTLQSADACEEAAQTLAARCREASERGFSVAVGLPLSADDSLRFLDAVGADNLGLDYDILHAAREGRKPEKEIRQLNERIRQLRARDEGDDGSSCPIGMGVVRFEPIAAALNAVEFQGGFVIDAPPGGDAAASAAANLAAVQEALLWSQSY